MTDWGTTPQGAHYKRLVSGEAYIVHIHKLDVGQNLIQLRVIRGTCTSVSIDGSGNGQSYTLD